GRLCRHHRDRRDGACGRERDGLAQAPPAGVARSGGPAMTGEPQIVVERLRHTYRPTRGTPVLALDDVSIEVARREFLALLGPSGCGKSTLLYLVGGFLPVEGGAIRVDGRDVVAPGPDRGIVFQNFALFPWKTVRGNVLYGLERLGMARPEREARAQQ